MIGNMSRPGTAAALPALLAVWAHAGERTPAFPGAEGFGAYSKGGRGGRVILVTSLKDYVPRKERSIPGSLRAAVEAKGARMVVFRVSGTIELKGSLSIREPYLTLAGQSAPGGGVCLKSYGTSIGTHDVIVRHVRFRPGDTVGRALAKEGKKWETDALCITAPSRDVIVDHCSTSWANDEVLSVSGADITNVTVQWCIISESLNRSTHVKGPHGYGSLIRTNGNITFHHNLYAFHRSRSPRPGTYGEGSILFDFRNNVVHKGGRGYTAEDPVRMNYVGNYVTKTGSFSATSTATIYFEGNHHDGGKVVRGRYKKREEAFPAAPVATDAAKEAYRKVIESCGAVLPARDAVDERIVRSVRAGKGGTIDSQKQVGGWPELEGKTSPAPGHVAAWEVSTAGGDTKRYRIDLRDRRACSGDSDRDGYTDVEEWLNGTDPRKAD